MTCEQVGSSLDYTETIENICSVPVPLLADWASLFMLDEKLSTYIYKHSYHRDSVLYKKISEYFKNNNAIITESVLLVNALRLGRVTSEIREVPSPVAGFLMNVPLIYKSEILGFMILGSDKYFSAQDALIAEKIAIRAANAIFNARLYKQAVCKLQL